MLHSLTSLPRHGGELVHALLEPDSSEVPPLIGLSPTTRPSFLESNGRKPTPRETYWNMRVWSHIYGHLMPQYDLNKSIPIKVPVFLALGKEDYYAPYILWEDEKVQIPKLSVSLFEKSGHYSFYEEEELFREKLLAWIKGLNLVVR